MDTDQSSNMLSSIQSEVAKYQMLIEEENQKLKRYKVRNLCFSDETEKNERKSQLLHVYGRQLQLMRRNWMGTRSPVLCKFMFYSQMTG